MPLTVPACPFTGPAGDAEPPHLHSIFQFRNESERRVLNLSKLTLFGFGLTH